MELLNLKDCIVTWTIFGSHWGLSLNNNMMLADNNICKLDFKCLCIDNLKQLFRIKYQISDFMKSSGRVDSPLLKFYQCTVLMFKQNP